MTVWDGYFSAKQAEVAGIIEYEGEDGKPVQVTEVCIPGTAPSPWPDTKRVGTVTRYLRRLTTRGSVLK